MEGSRFMEKIITAIAYIVIEIYRLITGSNKDI